MINPDEADRQRRARVDSLAQAIRVAGDTWTSQDILDFAYWINTGADPYGGRRT